MLSILTESISNGSFGIYFRSSPGPSTKCCRRPSPPEILAGYVGRGGDQVGDAGAIILITARLSCPSSRPPGLDGGLPGADLGDLQPVRLHHRHLGGRLREAADHPDAGDHAADLPGRQLLFDQDAAAIWQTVALFNPVVYLISGFRWGFYDIADVGVGLSLGMTAFFLASAP